MRNMFFISIGIITGMISCQATDGKWENLIKEDISNWQQINGPAHYEVKDGVIIGTAANSDPSDDSFLCTRAVYGDFILEFETWVDPQMNSGVNIRSEARPDYLDGQVYGYQFEVDPSPRAWTGGIYDESRRLWLYTLDINTPAKKAYKNGEWNHCRIEAIGNSIRTWVNGIPCADLVDDMTQKGFIGLQVHGIGNDSTKAGIQAKWRNIRLMTENPDQYATPYQPVIPQCSYLENKLSSREAKEGWKLLWDGKTTNGWHGVNLETFPSSGWKIKDGILSTDTAGEATSSAGGDIVTKEKYKDFKLVVDFKYTSGANSGIKYFINSIPNKKESSSIGCEYQILDDRLHPDAHEGIAGNRKLAGLYDLIPPRSSRDNGPGEWNRATIIVKGNHVEHWLNGQMTLEYERGTDVWKDLVSKSKFNNWPNFGEATEGNILLQDHGFVVSFRNIKIEEL